MAKVAGLRPFSIQSYITDKLLGWMRGQTGSQLVSATRFIAANVKHFEAQSEPAWRQRLRINRASQTVCEKMPWLLAEGRVVLPEQRGGKQLVTPECLEGGSGWNLLFCALDRHFLVLNDAYCDGLSPEALAKMRELFRRCGATAFPNPELRELEAHDASYGFAALCLCASVVQLRFLGSAVSPSDFEFLPDYSAAASTADSWPQFTFR